MDLSALAGPEPGRAVSGLTEANVALTRCGLCSPSDHDTARGVQLEQGFEVPVRTWVSNAQRWRTDG